MPSGRMDDGPCMDSSQDVSAAVPSHAGRHATRRVLLTLLAAALVFLAADAAAPAGAPPPVPLLTAKLSRTPLDTERYERAKGCSKGAQKGMVAFQRLLESIGARGSSWGIFNCRRIAGSSSLSLHAEGRALDWRLDVADKADRAQALALIKALLAPDAQGRPHALARRLGIEELIFNCRYWGAGMPEMGRYRYCYSGNRRKVRLDRTLAHMDHIHIGMNWAGARMQTSFWRALR
jgi:hypothetical protein